MEKKSLNFSNATYLVGEKAWQRANAPHFRDRASFIPQLNKWLEDSGHLKIISDSAAPAPLNDIIEFFESEGHTPGQMHTIIKGKEKNIVFAGDLIPGSPWVHLPITMGYDRYPEKLIEEKEALYKKMIDQNLHIFFTHDAKYSMGQLTTNEKGQYIVDCPIEKLVSYEI